MGCEPSATLPITPHHPQHHKNNRKNVHSRKPVNPDEVTEAIALLPDQLTDEHIKFAVSTLHHHQLFGTLSKKELRVIAEEMAVARPTDPSGYVFKQGDMGTCFFLIHHGSVDIEIGGKIIRTLRKGDTFGELALLFSTPRTASIISRSKNCQFLVVKPLVYKKTLKKMRLEEQFRNSEAIEKVPLFSCLTNKQKHALSNTIKIMLFNPGETIFKAEDDAQALYIISDGHVRISIPGKKDIDLRSGEIFGEGAVQLNMKRSGTAEAVTKTMCSMMSRNDIETTLGSSICNLVFYNTKKWALMRSPVFKHFSAEEINRIIIAFESFELADQTPVNPKLYKGFIICLEGNINGEREGTIFNEQNWTNKTYKCEGELVKEGKGHCGYLSFAKTQEIFEEIASKKKMANLKDKKGANNGKFNLSNLTYLKKLGEGQFGQVFLVKNVQFGTNLYAIKCLSKEYIRKEELEETVAAEKQILEKIIFPYIVGFVKAFHDKKYIYLLMEYIHGKELFDVIREVKSMTSDMVRYYFGCLLLSIECLHSNNIVYRDLKPENSVVDHKGKAFLIDLGTAKELNAENYFKTFTIIGTPHYMAPEVFEGNGYSFEADYWSLGCVLYEFLCFRLPFGDTADSDPYSVYTSIKKSSLSFPKSMKDERVKKLIASLLMKDPHKRSELTFEKIKKSQYFSRFDWNGLLEEDVKGPYIPRQFRSNPLEQLRQMEGKDFLKHIYNSSKDRSNDIEEWNATL